MRVPSPAASTMVRLDRAVIRIPEAAQPMSRRRRHKAFSPRHGNRFRRSSSPPDSRLEAAFPVNVCGVIRRGLGRAEDVVWQRIPTNWPTASRPKIPAAVLTGFLAEEDDFDRRALWRLGSWGVGSVGAVVVACSPTSPRSDARRDQVAAADLARQAQQIQSVAKESQNETRRLASAVDTLNSDRDRLYSRVTVLEQGLDSVTGAIAQQNAARRARRSRRRIRASSASRAAIRGARSRLPSCRRAAAPTVDRRRSRRSRVDGCRRRPTRAARADGRHRLAAAARSTAGQSRRAATRRPTPADGVANR